MVEDEVKYKKKRSGNKTPQVKKAHKEVRGTLCCWDGQREVGALE